MRARRGFYALACFTIIASTWQSLGMRIIWNGFAIAFLIAADKIKDIERVRQRERDLTEIRMEKEMLEGWEESLAGRYQFTITNIGKAFESALAQLSTYVKDASPTKVAYRKLPEDDAK